MEKSEDETNTDNNAYNSIGDDTIDENIYAPKSSCKRNRELNTGKLTLAMFKNRLHKDYQEERYVPK